MSTYLHIASGPFRFLIDIDKVIEVGDIDAAHNTDAAGRRTWRDRNLPVVDLCTAAGATGTRAKQQVIVRDNNSDEAAFVLSVEQIMELLEIEDSLLQPLAEITDALASLVDAAWPDQAGKCLLRLRTPFTFFDQPHPHGAITP